MKQRNGSRHAFIAVAVATALAVSACGNTDSSDTSMPATSATAAPAASTTATATAATPPAPSWPLTAPAASLPVTVTDANGASVTVTSIDRIASLQGDISEILWTLGLSDKIAVVDTTAVYPDTLLKTKPNAGFFRTMSAEGLLAQKPTVVLAHPGAGPAEVLAAVKAAGIPIVVIPEFNGTDLLEAGKKIKAIGAAVGLADHAAKLATQVDSDISKAIADAKAAAKTPPVAAYIVPRGQQVFLTGLDSPSNAIIEAAGGSPAAKLLKLDKATLLTPEALAAVQPQFIVSTFTAVAQAGGDAAFLSIAGIADTPAAKNKKLLQFDDTLVQQLGPRTGQAVRELSKKFFA